MKNKQIFSEKTLNSLGLILNIIGSIILASSVVKNPGMYAEIASGGKIYGALLDEVRAGIGISLLFLGFIIMFIANQYKK